jgi:hypothetical protein
MKTIDAVSPILRAPAQALALDIAGWERLLRQARRANLVARIARDLETRDLLTQVPTAPRTHLGAALTLAARQRITLRAEVRRVAEALAQVGLPLVLLKGAAYALADLPCADGRIFGDIDLLVPKDALPDAESALLLHGWSGGTHSGYDQRYYRQWMHEIPPLTHLKRQSVLDVHHNILPATSANPPDAAKLLEAAVSIENEFGLDIRTLAPIDMVLHSASHLFHEGEFGNGLRDLADLDRLLRHFGAEDVFWPQLTARAKALGLGRELFYALHLCALILVTPVPAGAVAAMAADAPRGPQAHLMDALFLRALRPDHRLADDRWTPLARWLLYVRGHWLRMPPHLLGVHLARKAWYRWTGFDEHPAWQDPDEQNKKGH